MPLVVITTLAAAAVFAAFHVPVPRRHDGRWSAARVPERLVPVFGIVYHLLMLPAVAALPAPVWAKAAGFAWMLLDAVLEGAALAGATADVRSLRDGVHLVASVWVVVAGWTAGPVLGLAGTALAAAFCSRLALRATGRTPPSWLLHLNAILNVVWMVLVAVALR